MDIALHADDLGLHPAVNDAILAAAEAGTLTGVSLVANGLAAADAVAAAHELPRLGLSLHLNIVRGRPLADPAVVPSLVNREGLFFNSLSRLLWRALAGRLRTEEIEREYRLQLAFVLDRGLKPSRLDSEKHHHLVLPQAAGAAARLAAEAGIASIRVVRETEIAALLAAKGIRTRANPTRRMMLSMVESRSQRSAMDWPTPTRPELTFGVATRGHVDPAGWLEALDALFSDPTSAVVEWIFHPGFDAAMDQVAFTRLHGRLTCHEARRQEAAFLLSQQLRDLCARHRERMYSWTNR
jgi:predicted glycoside hydrolase/deacetylase ChbG (UPF0249 family)